MQVERRQRSGVAELLLAVLLPLGILALAYALWAISDRLLYIGPLDRAAFGWIVVMPVSWVAPGITGLVWSGMSTGRRSLAAILLWGIVAAVAGILVANGIDWVDCQPVTSWTDVLPGSLAVGAVIGAGPALGGWFAMAAAGRASGAWRWIAAIATGGIVAVVGLFAAIMTFVFFFPPIACAPVLR